MQLVKKKNNNLLSAFQIEKLRDEYARNRDIKNFRNTYSDKYPEIPNKNYPKLWDNLNKRPFIDKNINPIAWERLNIVKKYLKKESLILDIGFGAGDLERCLFDSNFSANLYGIDISKGSVNSAIIKYPNWTFKIGGIDSLPFENEYFDQIVSLEVLEHISPSKVFKSLKEINRVLKKNGTIIISIPINENLQKLVQSGINPNAHVRVYSLPIITTELSISGFAVKKIHTLFAFSENYKIKSFVSKILPFLRKPNNLIIFATKN